MSGAKGSLVLETLMKPGNIHIMISFKTKTYVSQCLDMSDCLTASRIILSEETSWQPIFETRLQPFFFHKQMIKCFKT